jgi:hypothetical protein
MEHIKLYNEDCFEAFKKVKDKSVNLFLLDLPYGQTACKWDSVIDLEKMWKEIKRTLVKEGIVVMFCTTKFGFTLIQSNPKWFKYDLVWKKSKKVGFLSANKMPLRQHEMMYVFKDKGGTYNPQKTEGKPYKTKGHDTENYYRKDGVNVKIIETDNKGDRHPTSIVEKEPEFKGVITDSYYSNSFKRQVSDPHAPKHPTSVIEKEPDHEMMYVFKDKGGTYNPQKTKLDKEDKRNRKNDGEQDMVYGENVNLPIESSYKDRHPNINCRERTRSRDDVCIQR